MQKNMKVAVLDGRQDIFKTKPEANGTLPPDILELTGRKNVVILTEFPCL